MVGCGGGNPELRSPKAGAAETVDNCGTESREKPSRVRASPSKAKELTEPGQTQTAEQDKIKSEE